MPTASANGTQEPVLRYRLRPIIRSGGQSMASVQESKATEVSMNHGQQPYAAAPVIESALSCPSDRSSRYMSSMQSTCLIMLKTSFQTRVLARSPPAVPSSA